MSIYIYIREKDIYSDEDMKSFFKSHSLYFLLNYAINDNYAINESGNTKV